MDNKRNTFRSTLEIALNTALNHGIYAKKTSRFQSLIKCSFTVFGSWPGVSAGRAQRCRASAPALACWGFRHGFGPGTGGALWPATQKWLRDQTLADLQWLTFCRVLVGWASRGDCGCRNLRWLVLGVLGRYHVFMSNWAWGRVVLQAPATWWL